MPSVADLLENASAKPQLARSGKPKESGPSAGKNRGKGGGSGGEEEEKTADTPKPKIPSIVDMESSQQPPDESDSERAGTRRRRTGDPRLTLPVTTIAGPPKSGEGPT